MLESGMRIVEIPAAESESAVMRPENLRAPRSVGSVAEREWPTYDGAVSATMTVNFLFRAAFFRNASTVLELPIVRMNSLRTATSQPCVTEREM